jgi:hypothetical protein
MAYKQEVNVSLILTIGIVSGIFLLVTVIGTQAWYQSEEQNEFLIKSEEATARSLTIGLPNATFAELKEGQLHALDAKAHWTDAKKRDRVAIPINDAIAYLEGNAGKLP